MAAAVAAGCVAKHAASVASAAGGCAASATAARRPRSKTWRRPAGLVLRGRSLSFAMATSGAPSASCSGRRPSARTTSLQTAPARARMASTTPCSPPADIPAHCFQRVEVGVGIVELFLQDLVRRAPGRARCAAARRGCAAAAPICASSRLRSSAVAWSARPNFVSTFVLVSACSTAAADATSISRLIFASSASRCEEAVEHRRVAQLDRLEQLAALGAAHSLWRTKAQNAPSIAASSSTGAPPAAASSAPQRSATATVSARQPALAASGVLGSAAGDCGDHRRRAQSARRGESAAPARGLPRIEGGCRRQQSGRGGHCAVCPPRRRLQRRRRLGEVRDVAGLLMPSRIGAGLMTTWPCSTPLVGEARDFCKPPRQARCASPGSADARLCRLPLCGRHRLVCNRRCTLAAVKRHL